jgi:hypothetical protein
MTFLQEQVRFQDCALEISPQFGSKSLRSTLTSPGAIGLIHFNPNAYGCDYMWITLLKSKVY